MMPAPTASQIQVARTVDDVLHVAGVQRCASVASCPVCSPVIRERRAHEIDAGIRFALDRGCLVVMITATVSHHLGDHLRDVLDLVAKSWGSTFSGRQRALWRATTGYWGQIRSIEITHGDNGWHPHIHALLVFEPGSSATVDSLRALGVEFARQVARRGGTCDVVSAASPGWNVSEVTTPEAVAGYLTKVQEAGGGSWSAGLELARGDLKTAGRHGLKPFDLLALASNVDAPASVQKRCAAALWTIYESTMVGRRVILWSPGLQERLGVVEVDDELAAVADPEAPIVAVWYVPAEEWRWLVSTGFIADAMDFWQTADPPPI